MGDPLSTTASIITLVALLKLCLTAFEVVHVLNNKDTDLDNLESRWAMLGCRLQIWGQKVGLIDDSKASSSSDLISGSPYEGPIRRALRSIHNLLTDGNTLIEKYGAKQVTNSPAIESSSSSYSLLKAKLLQGFGQGFGQGIRSTLNKTKRASGWVMMDKEKLEALIIDLRYSINDMEEVTKPLIDLEKFLISQIRISPNFRLLQLLQDACREDHRALSDAASVCAETLSTSTGQDMWINNWISDTSVIDDIGDDPESWNLADYRRKYIQLEQTKQAMDSQVQIKAQLRQDLPRSWRDHKEYVPISTIHAYLTETNIRKLLGSDISKLDDTLVGFIQSRALIVFSILIELNKVYSVHEFQLHGFDDSCLPMPSPISEVSRPAPDPGHPIENCSLQAFENWTADDIHLFCKRQWRFKPHVFDINQTYCHLDNMTILPLFQTEESKEYKFPASGFPMSIIARIHSAQQIGFPVVSPGIPRAIIKRRIETDISMKSEADGFTTEVMLTMDSYDEHFRWMAPLERALLESRPHHDHLLKPYTIITQGTDRYRLCPRPEGGVLRHLFYNCDPNPTDVEWVIRQILGLSEALTVLQEKNWVWIDPYPERFWLFGATGTSSCRIVMDDSSSVPVPTETETERDRRDQLCADDVRSLGCIFFEIIFWVLYGKDGISLLHDRSWGWKLGYRWEEKETNKLFGDCVDRMHRKDPRCGEDTVLGHTLRFLQKRMIVEEEEEGRGTADDCLEFMRGQVRKASENPDYLSISSQPIEDSPWPPSATRYALPRKPTASKMKSRHKK